MHSPTKTKYLEIVFQNMYPWPHQQTQTHILEEKDYLKCVNKMWDEDVEKY